MLAPFVTASEPGSVVLLLTYGWVVIALSLFAIRERGWAAVLWLTVAGAMVVRGRRGRRAAQRKQRLGGNARAGALRIRLHRRGAFVRTPHASLEARTRLSARRVPRDAELLDSGADDWSWQLSLVGTVASYLIARELETDARWLVIGNVIVPLCFLFATVASATDRSVQALAGAALAVVASFLAWEDEDERAEHLFVACIASGIAIFTSLVDYDTRCVAAFALHAALFTLLFRSTRAKLLLPPIILELTIVTAWTFLLLDGRLAYAYTPFATIPSLLALAVVSAWAWLAYALEPVSPTSTAEDHALFGIVSALAIAIAFLWIRQELAHAWSADAASFALIIYYAVAGLVLIFAGRWRGVGLLRAAGLGLAFLAGFDAIVETFGDRLCRTARGRANPGRRLPRGRSLLVPHPVRAVIDPKRRSRASERRSCGCGIRWCNGTPIASIAANAVYSKSSRARRFLISERRFFASSRASLLARVGAVFLRERGTVSALRTQLREPLLRRLAVAKLASVLAGHDADEAVRVRARPQPLQHALARILRQRARLPPRSRAARCASMTCSRVVRPRLPSGWRESKARRAESRRGPSPRSASLTPRRRSPARQPARAHGARAPRPRAASPSPPPRARRPLKGTRSPTRGSLPIFEKT